MGGKASLLCKDLRPSLEPSRKSINHFQKQVQKDLTFTDTYSITPRSAITSGAPKHQHFVSIFKSFRDEATSCNTADNWILLSAFTCS